MYYTIRSESVDSHGFCALLSCSRPKTVDSSFTERSAHLSWVVLACASRTSNIFIGMLRLYIDRLWLVMLWGWPPHGASWCVGHPRVGFNGFVTRASELAPLFIQALPSPPSSSTQPVSQPSQIPSPVPPSPPTVLPSQQPHS